MSKHEIIWDDPDPEPELSAIAEWERKKRNFELYGGCAGWASYDGPCGATDCPRCNPHSQKEDEEEEDETATREDEPE